MKLNCNLCSNPLTDKIYESGSARSLTSLCTSYMGATQVYFCHCCGHLQSAEIDNIEGYYDSDYDILVTSDEEDQIYEVIHGRNVYRTEHQVETLLNKVALSQDAMILDYGCAKSSTMRTLLNKNNAVRPHLFDVSNRYIPFWEKFLPEDCWATYSMPDKWNGQFDVVTSFFSLEHMARPQDALWQIFRVLSPVGIFYGIIPNVFSNTADMIVVDHVNHFTEVSLSYLLCSQGFDVIEIDERVHKGALVFVAKKGATCSAMDVLPVESEVKTTYQRAYKIAEYWKTAGSKIRAFEQTIAGDKRVAIYGAGFYGAFVSSSLAHSERVEYIVDQNPFLQGPGSIGIPIVSPANLPKSIDTVFVGLNPAHAKRLISDIAEFRDRDIIFFYL